jgi:N-acetylglucosaminyldiphosphoundecaprenol N-acetyl-beta-D-mannosaminyltransferase
MMEKNRNRISLLNIQLNNLTIQELLENLDQGMVVTPNIDHMVKLQKDENFYKIYQQADYVLLDSRVIYYMLKLSGSPIKGVIPGSDLLPAFYQYHKDNPSISMFLLGAMDGIANKARDKINSKVKREIITGAYSPSYGFEKKPEECNKITRMINQSGANVLIIGVGAPKQEKWLHQYMSELYNIKLALALGASIDFEAGLKKRSPRWLQMIGMEWFYRFICEPRRLWKRYFIDDLPFIFLFIKQKLGKYQDPFRN